MKTDWQKNRYEANSPNIVSETIDQETIVLNLDEGIYYSLRDIASDVWNCLTSGYNPQEVVAAIAELGSTSKMKDEIVAEVLDFIEQLINENLFRLSEEPSELKSTIDFAGASGVKTYLQPTMNKFDDMAKILVLDPIHEVDVEVDDGGWPIPKE